jgi:hypothetical protein
MPFKPPLTRSDLQAIHARSPGNADVQVLLWEIKRLRAIVLRADQLQRSVGGLGGGLGGGADIILNALRDEIKDEPCIAESPKIVLSK